MRNRIILIGLALAVWLGLKFVDCLVTGPELLILLCIGIVVMATHSLWLLAAQRRWRKQTYLSARNPCSANKKDDKDDQWEPWVDIFIAAKNEARVIETTVRNMFKLDYE